MPSMLKFILGGMALVALASTVAVSGVANSHAANQSANTLRCKVVTHPTHADDVSTLEAVWKFSMTVSACYNGKRIVRPGVTCSVWHTDPITIVNNGCSTQYYFYSWRGNPYGGYYAQAEATFQNCIIKFACVKSDTVTIKIWMTGNGAWIPAVTH